jgi:hypothetical protein
VALVVQALLAGAVEVPASSTLRRGQIARADNPSLYWLLVLAYAVGGALFLATAWRRYRQAEDMDYESPPPPPPQPAWAKALAWLGVACGTLLLAAAVWFHFALDPIMSLPFVFLSATGGLSIGLASVGYLVTGRLQ